MFIERKSRGGLCVASVVFAFETANTWTFDKYAKDCPPNIAKA